MLKASPRMFESTLLDKLSRVHPTVPLYIFVPAIVVLFTLGAASRRRPRQHRPRRRRLLLLDAHASTGCTGSCSTSSPRTGIGARLHWIIHGVHHDHPNDPLRLVMPPSVSVPLALVFYGLFVTVLPTASANLFAAGFLTGYLGYDMLHYHVHHHRPRTRLGKLLRELHMRHHFQDDTCGFGVSAPFWDRVFGTSQRRSAPG